MFIQTKATARATKVRTDGRIGDFGNFFNGLAKTAHACFDRPEY